MSGLLWFLSLAIVFAVTTGGVSAQCDGATSAICITQNCTDNVTQCTFQVTCSCPSIVTARSTTSTTIVVSSTTATTASISSTGVASTTATTGSASTTSSAATTGSTTSTNGCVPKTCITDVNCSNINDGCGGTLDCGACDAFPNSFCASDNTCQCTPKNCSQLGFNECGTVNASDGCGGIILAKSCGTCNGTSTCIDGTCQDAACNATTSCEQENRTCGTLVIGQPPCTNVSCGLCSSPDKCTTDGQCSCTPFNTCAGRCGPVDLGCGQVFCPFCNGICVDTYCVSTNLTAKQATGEIATAELSTQSSLLPVIIGASVGAMLLLCCVVASMLLLRRKSSRNFDDQSLDQWALSLDEVELGDRLASGAFGVVLRGVFRGNECVVKQLHAGDNVTTSDETALACARNELMAEARVLSKVKPHASITAFFGCNFATEPCFICTEFHEGGSLEAWIRNSNKMLRVRDVCSAATDIAAGLSYLHALNIIHADVAARNCLIKKEPGSGRSMRVVLCDFGLAQVLEKRDSTTVPCKGKIFAVRWSAPELFDDDVFSVAIDSWAWAVTVWEVATRGKIPYGEFRSNKRVAKYVHDGNRLSFPSTLCDAYDAMQCVADEAAKCWSALPSERPTMEDVASSLRTKIRGAPDNPVDCEPASAESNELQPSDDIDMYVSAGVETNSTSAEKTYAFSTGMLYSMTPAIV